ncbi:MAG: aldolase [Candidatus Gracilibacteria bacterium]
MNNDILVPLDVPANMHDEYRKNYDAMTRGTGKLMLFAGDQKVEHLNDDFVGDLAHEDDADPEHLFKVADAANIGVFATQLGMIARYGMDYKEVPYMVKMNSKTHLVKTSQKDPLSLAWYDLEQVASFKKRSGLNILGVGFTVYCGSEFEATMLREAAQLIFKAHEHGLVTCLWMYPRGTAVADEKDPHLVAGAAGVAATLGSDFAKVNYPKAEGANEQQRALDFQEAIVAAGRTKVVCAGGSSKDNESFLKELYDQLHVSGAMGNATGRNIHQKSFDEAVKMTNAIYALTIEDASVEEAVKMLA